MKILGIDPGLDGGLAFIDTADNKTQVTLAITPTITAGKGSTKRTFDRAAMLALLKAQALDLAIIEAVWAAPVAGRTQGVASMFGFGKGVGLWLGMLTALEIPHQEVTPQLWKGKILAGTTRDKQAAIEFCQRRFPGASLLASPRCKKPHDGLADALCLAEYGRRLLGGA
jgi:crossover junction endodeoxyribonuclease RuvC